MRATVLRNFRIDAHAADRIEDGRRASGALATAIAAAAGPAQRPDSMMIAALRRRGAVCLIAARLRHQNPPRRSAGPLNNIPCGGI